MSGRCSDNHSYSGILYACQDCKSQNSQPTGNISLRYQIKQKHIPERSLQTSVNKGATIPLKYLNRVS